MKLDVDRFIYHNIPLKDVKKIESLNRMYSDPQKKRKYCDSNINKDNNRINKNQIMMCIQILTHNFRLCRKIRY